MQSRSVIFFSRYNIITLFLSRYFLCKWLFSDGTTKAATNKENPLQFHYEGVDTVCIIARTHNVIDNNID